MLLKAADTLYKGETYTFTFAHGKIVELNNSDSLLSSLRQIMASNYGEIVSVDRPLFSSHYVIVVRPSIDRLLSDWIKTGYGLAYGLKSLGYDKAVFIQAEGGERSSKAGGLSQMIPSVTGQVAQVASETINSVVKPLFLPIAVGVAIFLFVKLKK